MLAAAGLSYIRRRYYHLVGKTIQHREARWSVTLALLLFYFYRVAGLSYDVITYLIGFYLLQLLVSYLTPQGLEQNEAEEYAQPFESELIPVVETEVLIGEDFELDSVNEPEKPLVSSLTESQVWERITFAFVLGIVCTLFKQIEIDVFWPLLMLYFVVLLSYTILKIVRKMQKYNYSLSDFNKKATTASG